MNDPNKRIDIDKSSLLSLKAELLRKQQEVNDAKTIKSVQDFVPKKEPKVEKDKKKPKHEKSVEIEDSLELEKSKKILEAKAKYYDRMTTMGGSLNSDENCLVMFNEKKQIERHNDSKAEVEAISSSADEYSSNDDDVSKDNEWVEYTDCLGRTRKCLRKDLESFKQRDDLLAGAMTKPPDNRNDGDQEIEQENDEVIGPMPSKFLEKNTQDVGERFLEMRQQWEKQEQANFDKDFVHYSDVLFNEARNHGVGYFQFSTDAEERRKQMNDLQDLRDSTLEAQKDKEDVRKMRDKMIADRVKAAKARQRARMGLPPEEEKEEEKQSEKEEEMFDTEEEMKRKRKEEKERRRKEKDEKKREKERQNHLRPWDEGKEGQPEWQPKFEKEPMTQEQWNEMKRQERQTEFAPFYFDTKGKPPEPEIHEEPLNPFYATTKKKDFKRKNYDAVNKASSSKIPKMATKIRNELSESSSSDEDDRSKAAVPPPMSYDPAKIKPSGSTDLEKSIEAGLAYLRSQSDKYGGPATKNKWTANADY